MQEIISAMREHGFVIDSLALDGKIHRFGEKKKSNWYLGFRNFTKSGGEAYYVVKYGSWKTGESFLYQSNADYSASDKSEIRKQIEAAQKKAEAERLRVQIEVADEVARIWETLSECEITPYMQRKQIREHFQTRTRGDVLYVPMRDVEGRLWGMQKIQSDGSKFFFPGQRVSGLFHSIGSIEDSETIFIAEGFATGASIYAAVERAVVIAFNASNLVNVASELHKKYPNKKFLICGDDDQFNEKNAGREYGDKAAAKIMCQAIYPQFRELDSKPTDFNDLHILEGLDSVRNQISPQKAKSNYVAPLGFREKEYFFTSSSNKQIVSIRSFSDVEFLNLMPREYWENCYAGVKGGVDWGKAKSELMTACRERGIFQTKNVRGAGVWMDQKRVVVNHGDHLMVDGVKMDLQDLKSKYFYTLGKRISSPNVEPLTLDECELITTIGEAFKWQKKDFGKLLIGALITQKLCGATPIRPHVWLTGGSQTGKTTLLERLVRPTLAGYSLYFLGGTSEAGLRQSLGSDSIPVIFDEFETNGQKSSETIQSCVELMRSAWSESHGVIAKGSAGGNANFYQPRFSAIVSSIRPNLTNDADRSRFTMLELAPHGSDPEHWKFLESLLNQYDQTYVDRLFARSLKNLKTMLQNYVTLKSQLSQKVGARFGQQYGMLLAGWSILKFDAPLTAGQALKIVSEIDFTDERDEVKVTDELELVHHIALSLVRVGMADMPVAEAISQCTGLRAQVSRSNAGPALDAIGIRVIDDSVYVASRHPILAKLLANTRWASCWSTSLSRLDGAEKNRVQRFGGKLSKSVKIPLHFFCN